MNDDRSDEDRLAILDRRRRFIALALGGLASGCVPPEASSDGGTTTVGSSSTSSSTSTEVGTEVGTETEPELDTDTDTGSLFFVPTTPRPCLSECDPFAQDCPEGEKCVGYDSASGTWDANKCVPVEGDGALGEPCTYGGPVAATDDCGETTACWDIQDVDGTPTGVCTAFCEGTADDPICAEGTTCLIANEGSIVACITACDPLLQDCDVGLACAWLGDAFGCLVTSTGLPAGEVCDFTNECAPGSLCAAAVASPICAGEACCVDYCSVDDPMTCPDPQLECAAFFADGLAPAGLESLGICVPPGACDGEDPCLVGPVNLAPY